MRTLTAIGIMFALVLVPTEARADDTYTIRRDWDAPFRLRGLGFGAQISDDPGGYFFVGDMELLMLRARVATIRTGAMGTRMDLGAVGLRLPPYGPDWFQPYVMYHWNGEVEAGVHVEALTEAIDEHFGFDLFATVPVLHDGAPVFGAGVSLGDIRDSYEPTQAEYRLATAGVSYVLGRGVGVRGSVLDVRYGPISTNLLDVHMTPDLNAGYVSFFPVGVVIPPTFGDFELQYRFHWAPILTGSDTGVHVLEATLDFSGEDEGNFLLHAAIEGGADMNDAPWGAASVSFGYGSL
jgi:hypothetical protein